MVVRVTNPRARKISITHPTCTDSFYINLPCGAFAAAATMLFLRIPKAAKLAEALLKEKLLQMDITGFVFITASVLCYLLALQWGGVEKRWSSADVIGTLIGFGAL